MIRYLFTVFSIALLTACNGTSDRGYDRNPPVVIYNTPDSGSTDVTVDISISVNFNKDIDKSTVTSDTFLVSSGIEVVPGNVAYSGKTATFVPISNLDFNKTYTVTITTGLKDLADRPLAEDYTWMFATCNENGRCAARDCLNVTRKNIILFIGDGMGFEQIKAAGIYANGSAGTLSFESFPYNASVSTHNFFGDVTDSAAAATAIATGEKVSNGVISVADPGDGSPLETILEHHKEQCRSTGLVTTTNIEHATPAAFGAHASGRNDELKIATDYLRHARPNVLFGGATYINNTNATNAGYTVVTDSASLQSIDISSVILLSGQFSSGYMPYEFDGFYGSIPHLSNMTSYALDILDNDPEGFFLMVEGGRIDHAGHANNIQRNINETIEFSRAVQVAISWARGRDDTLILVTADHETGGLTVLQNNGAGTVPDVSWVSGNHTGVNVPLFAWGRNAVLVSGILDNTDLFGIAQ